MSSDSLAGFPAAAQAFRRFFGELRDTFLEREALLTQIELALLSREHVLVVGPPGTAKSVVAVSVLSRITDERTGKPSLFSKQLAESTVQTDLIGAVDFKVLTETGRTEYLTDEGMLGSTYAFLDEVFDGRDMLLRSILNVLHERELKHGKKVTAGKCETAIMTSNRYLSEVLARSPELLLAFADRLGFICFCPKSFARRTSRAAMLDRFARGQRPDLRAALTLQQLDVLQDAVDRVKVPGAITEMLEQLADGLERVLAAQVAKLPDYVPTKYFSQRSLVKAMWALKAAVVRDRILRRPDRPAEIHPEDLEALRYYFLLGGPPPEETEALLAVAVDPRERAQLEIIRLEHRVFDEALGKLRAESRGGRDREGLALKADDELSAADAVARSFQPQPAAALAQSLRTKLVPGPRYPENRSALVAAARLLAGAFEARLARGVPPSSDGRTTGALFPAFLEVLDLYWHVPELTDRHQAVVSGTLRFCRQALQLITQGVEGTGFEDATVEALAELARTLDEELSRVTELAAAVASMAPDEAEGIRAQEAAARRKAGSVLRQRVTQAFHRGTRERAASPLDALAADAKRLADVEMALIALSPEQLGLRQELLGPLGVAFARDALGAARFDHLEQFSRVVQSVMEQLRSEGLSPGPVLAVHRDLIHERLRQHAVALAQEVLPMAPEGQQPHNGEAYLHYKQKLVADGPGGELAALLGLETTLSEAQSPGDGGFVAGDVRQSVARAELVHVHARVRYLRRWLTQLLEGLPPPEKLGARAEAERAFDRLVRSRFPLLATREGELVRLQTSLELLQQSPGEVGDAARRLEQAVRELAGEFGGYSQRLLQARAALPGGR